MLADYFDDYPEERTFWKYDSLKAIVAGVDDSGFQYSRFDELTPCHPTPVYELLLGVIGYFILTAVWRPSFRDGRLFMVYLMLSALFRFSVEFLRLQPKLLFGLSEAQLFAIALFIAGFFAERHLRTTPAKAGDRPHARG
jgi:prolipoprotein diacylglyceryltransferase